MRMTLFLYKIIIHIADVFPVFQYFNGSFWSKYLPQPVKLSINYHTITETNEAFNVLHYKETHIPGHFTLDAKGFAGWHSSCYEEDHINPVNDKHNKLKEIDKNGLFKLRKIQSSYVSKHKQPDDIENHIRSLKNICLVATQLVDDIVSRNAYIHGEELVEHVLKLALSMKHVNFVIKRHPYCKNSKISALLDKAKSISNIHISSGNITKLIDLSKCVLVVNSGVGFEALMLNKKVIICGLSDYNPGCTTVFNRDQLTTSLEQVFQNYETRDQAQFQAPINFVSHYINQSIYKIDCDESAKQISREICKLLYQ